ncbi:MAG: hypothetical protein AAF702_27370 [Chloroflexota bacterium]
MCDACGLSVGYVGIFTVAGAIAGILFTASLGFLPALAAGLVGAFLGLVLGFATLPVAAIAALLAFIAGCVAAFVGLCYGSFLVAQWIML